MRLRVWVVGASLALAGCLPPRDPWSMTLPVAGLRPTLRLEGIRTDRQAAESVLAIFDRDFGIAPFPVTFHYYPVPESFERALRAEGHPAAFARAMAETLGAIGGPERVVFNERLLAPLSWSERVHVIAHELVHTVQYVWSGGQRGGSAQWLREGFAEWLALQALQRLHPDAWRSGRAVHVQALHASRRAAAPRLSELAEYAVWVELRPRTDLALYSQAFLAVELLVERYGAPAVIRYFELFRTSADPLGNFRAAFHEDVASFETRAMREMWER